MSDNKELRFFLQCLTIKLPKELGQGRILAEDA